MNQDEICGNMIVYVHNLQLIENFKRCFKKHRSCAHTCRASVLNVHCVSFSMKRKVESSLTSIFFWKLDLLSLNHRKYLNMRDKIKARTIYMNGVKNFNC